MNPLSEAQLASMRACAAVTMLDVADIVRPTLTPDEFGGQSAADTTVATGVPCQVKALSGFEINQLDKTVPVANYAISVPVGTDIQVSDAIVTRGRRFEVQHVPDDTIAVRCRVLCSQVEESVTS